MRKTVATALEAVGLSLFPGLSFVFFVLILTDALVSFPKEFVASEVVPYFALVTIVPVVILVLSTGVVVYYRRQERRLDVAAASGDWHQGPFGS